MPVRIPPALASFLDVLRCPTCLACLRSDHGTLRCPACHTFDISRHGVVSLLTGAKARSGDDAAMARARERFLASGKYGRIRGTVARLSGGGAVDRPTVVDVGCGTGYYLSGVLDHLPGARGLGLDSSVRALRATARAHERALAASCDVFRRLPLANGAVDVVLDVFAPRNPSEFHRVLRRGGRLVVVRPTARHLEELRGLVPGMVAVDPAKERRLHESLMPYFVAENTESVEHRTTLTRSEAGDLVGMTPSARHVGDAELADVDLDLEHVTLSVLATAYRRR